jgi:flagellar FliJ protein
MFKFKLESLLNHRKHLEDCLQKELAAAENALKKEQSELKQFRFCYNRCEAEFIQKKKKGLANGEVALHAEYLNRLSTTITSQKAKIKNSQRVRQHKRQELLRAMQARKTIDKLKEKQLGAYHQKSKKDEQNLLNETAISRFNRNHHDA